MYFNMCFLLDDLVEDVDHHMMEAVLRSVLGSMSEPNLRICSGRWFESKLGYYPQ
jgi:hypothetical protein